MNAVIRKIVTITLMFSTFAINAQNKIYDVITLKDGMGVVKGFIDEQILDENPAMLITPIEALLTINVDEIEGGRPTTKLVNGTTKDLIVLKGSGEEIVGNIVSESIGKWYKISASNLSQKSYLYSDISKLSKEFEDANGSIYDVYGVLECITLNSGITISGIVTEQELGVNLTVKDVKDGMDKIIDSRSVVKIEKSAYRKEVDIFDQYAYIDIVETSSGVFKGVIVSQKFGESVTVYQLEGGTYSTPIPYSKILSIRRELNTRVKRSSEVAVVEVAKAAPEGVVETTEVVKVEAKEEAKEDIKEEVEKHNVLEEGLYAYEDYSNRFIESYTYSTSKDDRFYVLNGAQMTLSDTFEIGNKYSFILKVNSSNDTIETIMSSFKIWNLSTNPDRQTKYIEINSKKKKKDDDYLEVPGVLIDCEECGPNLLLVTLTPNVAGEYAITYLYCTNIAIFNVK